MKVKTGFKLIYAERIERSENVKSLKDYLERTDEMIERKKAHYTYSGRYYSRRRRRY